MSSDGGDAYVSPWSAECTKNSTMKLQALGDELDTIRQGVCVCVCVCVCDR